MSVNWSLSSQCVDRETEIFSVLPAESENQQSNTRCSAYTETSVQAI